MLATLPLLSHLSAKYHHLVTTARNPNLPLPCRQAVAMAISIEELDVLVRSFYEGRGEQVGFFSVSARLLWSNSLTMLSSNSKKPPRPL